MPLKTNINNLTIVWQGQSWSVISPNGVVVARFKDKQEAKVFAENIKKYLSGEYPQYSEDEFYQKVKERPTYITEQFEKLKITDLTRLKTEISESNLDFEVYKKRVGFIKYIVGVPLIILASLLLIVGVIISLLNIIGSLLSHGLDHSIITLTRSFATLLLPYEALVFAWWYFEEYDPHSSIEYITEHSRKALLKLTVAFPLAVLGVTSLVLGVLIGIGHSIYLWIALGGNHAFNFFALAFIWCLFSLVLCLGAVRYLDEI